jgi:hypothetical protein
MMTLVALLVAFAPQDEAKLKESWPKLVEAWKAVEAYKPAPENGPLDDEYLKVAAKLHGAFESAGLFAADGEYLPQAVKAFVKFRARALAPAAPQNALNRGMVIRRIRVAGAAPGVVESEPQADGNPMATLLNSLKKLQSLKQGGLDDEENVQDELATARKSLKALGITADNTPSALRRRVLRLVRALALGEAYPEPASATEEQAKQFRAWIADLGSDSIETREKATVEFRRASEASLPFLREALKSTDAEVTARARTLLGIGHAPWKTAGQQVGVQCEDVLIAPAPVLAAPPKATKEEKPK